MGRRRYNCEGLNTPIEVCLSCERELCKYDKRTAKPQEYSVKKRYMIRRTKEMQGEPVVRWVANAKSPYVAAVVDPGKAKKYRTVEEAERAIEICKMKTKTEFTYEIVERSEKR